MTATNPGHSGTPGDTLRVVGIHSFDVDSEDPEGQVLDITCQVNRDFNAFEVHELELSAVDFDEHGARVTVRSRIDTLRSDVEQLNSLLALVSSQATSAQLEWEKRREAARKAISQLDLDSL